MDDITLQDGDLDLFSTIVTEAVNYQAPIDQMTDRALVAKWPLGRIDPTLRSVFRAAGAELMRTDTPARVIISEYVELAAAFFPMAKSRNFRTPSWTTWHARPNQKISDPALPVAGCKIRPCFWR